MDRLTARDGFGTPYYPYCDNVKGCGGYCAQCNFETKTMDKLTQYEDLEEQGLLLRLPVPIGTTVYKFEPLAKGTKRYIETTVTRYEIFGDSIWFTFANGLGRNVEDFGEYVFLTQEEAEQKLKEMGRDSNDKN